MTNTQEKGFLTDLRHVLKTESRVGWRDTWRQRYSQVGTSILLLVAFGAVLVMIAPDLARWNERLLAKIMLATATVLPPAHFWFEYSFVWLTADEDRRLSLDEYKHAQGMARNLWLAFAAVIFALYFQN